MSLKTSITISCCFVFVVSCSLFENKNSFISDYSTLIEDVKNSGEFYNEIQWHEADSLFQLYSTDMFERYKPDLTQHDRDSVNVLTGEYIALRGINAGKNIISDLEDFGKQVESLIETLFDEQN